MTVNTTEYALSESVTAVANAQGVATAVIGPNMPHETWHVTNSATNGNSAATPTLTVYSGSVSAGNMVDGSNTANLDSSDTVYDMKPGEYLTVQWTGCTVGASMTFTLSGTRQVKGRRAY